MTEPTESESEAQSESETKTRTEAGSRGISRRRLLAVAGAAAGGLAVGSIAGGAIGATAAPDGDGNDTAAVPFFGEHQAGVATAAQDRLLFASFDVVTTRRAELEQLLRDWTVAAERLTQGQPVADPASSAALPATDTGEAEGLHPARLTLTFGVGPTLFEREGVGRFGLAPVRPDALADIPAFPGDALEEARSGGDLCVQACGDDPQVLFHAIRNLTRIGRGVVRVRWSQEGFGRTSSTTKSQSTPRNLLGFKDGTDNLRAESDEFDENVWVASGDEPSWMVGGSYMVTRRIRNLIEIWDRSSLAEQERVIGRVRSTGAPLGGTDELQRIDLAVTDAAGQPVIDPDAHVAVANQDALGIHILRRGYNFTDGLDPRVGQLDAGLFFIAYQRDPRTQFVPMQQRLAHSDLLNEYVKHVGSAVFAVPPGVAPGGWWGETLFGA
jgi:deferrochelatase/peroxidase EfeB